MDSMSAHHNARPATLLVIMCLVALANLSKPAIAQLVEHLTVECCSNQMVPGSIPGGRTFRLKASCDAVICFGDLRKQLAFQIEVMQKIVYTSRFVRVILAQGPC